MDSHLTNRQQMEDELRRRNRELAALNAIAVTVGQSLDLSAVLDAALEHSLAVLNAEGGIIYLFDATRRVFAPFAHRGFSENVLRELTGFRWGEGIAGHAAKVDEPVIVPHLASEARNLSPAAVQEGWQSLVCLPLKAKGQPVGVMTIESRVEGQFTADSLGLLAAIGHQVGAAIENARLFAETQQLKAFNESIVQGVAEAILIEDSRGILTFANPAAEKLLGYPRAELIGHPWIMVVPEDHREIVDRETARRPEGITTQYEAALLRKDGCTVPVIVSARPLFSDGRFTGVVSAFTDITARQRNEKRLARLTDCLLSFGPDPMANINRLVVLCGELLGAATALYNRLDKGMLCTWGRWQVPSDYPSTDRPERHICYDFIRAAGDAIVVLSDLPASSYAETDPAVRKYELQTYVGKAVRFGGHNVGVVCALFTEPFVPSDDDRRLIEIIASAIAVEEQRKQAEDALARRAGELAALHETVLEVSLQQDLNTLLHTIIERAVHLLHAAGGELHLCDPDRREVRCVVSYNTPKDSTGMILQYGEGAAGLVAQTGQPIIVDDYRTWPNRAIAFEDAAPLAALVAVPMIWQGQVIGVLNALDNTARQAFAPADLELLAMFAAQAAIAVVNARLLEAERTQRVQAEALRDTAATLASALSLNDVLDRVLAELGRVTPHDAAFITLVEDGVARVARSYGFAERGLAEALATMRMTIAELVDLRMMAETGQPVIVPDTQTYPGWVIFPATQWARSHVGAPLRVKGQLLGFLNLFSAIPGFFTHTRADNVKAFADQVAVAVENAQLFEAEREQRAQAEALRDTAAALAGALSFDEALGQILEQADRVVPHDAATIMVIENGIAQVVRSRGFVERGLPDPTRVVCFQLADTPNLREIIETGRPLAIFDTRRYASWVDLPETHWIGSHIGVPISSQGRVIGILNLDSATPGFFTAAHAESLRAFADQAAVAVERAQLFEAIRRRAAELEALADLSTVLRVAHPADEIIPIFLERSISISGAATGQIFRVERESGNLVIWGWYPPDLPFHPWQQVRHRIGEGVAGQVALTGEVHVTGDILSEPLASVLPEEAASLGIVHGGLTLPLRTASGRIIGVVQFGWRERHICTPEEVRLLVSVAEMTGNALDRAQVMDTLEQRVAERTVELSRREAELQTANARLADLERLKSQFLANASHELRTPLTNIKAYLDLLERGRPEKRDRYMTVLKRETDMLHLLIENLLNVAELDFGRAQPRLTQVHLNQLLETLRGTCNLLVADRALFLQLILAPDLPQLMADVRMLRQVITNLVSYANDQSPSGETLTLQTQGQQDAEGDWVILSVSGKWLSMAPALSGQGSAEVNRSQTIMPGAGLRLSICQEIVARLGGRITTEVGEDSQGRLRVWLPAAPVGRWGAGPVGNR
ncbi:MAG: GAF domain-containing protein [Chloroflexi bacterium]|nr:GAF domain-containing protein [Chloroflexota bacterium]